MTTDAKFTSDGNARVIMWCVPRSVSTAMTKCMSFVDGAEVWLEPYVVSKIAKDFRELYYTDFEQLPIDIDGNEEVYLDAVKKLNLGCDTQSFKLDLLSPIKLKQKFDSIPSTTKFVFVKDMASGMPPSRYQYLPDPSSGFRHFFLIRHPVKAYKSFRKTMLEAIEGADPKDLPPGFSKPDPETFHIIDYAPPPKEGTPYFFKAIHELWCYVRENVDSNPVIVDIDELMEDPATILPLLFRALGIPYSDDYVTWDASSDVVRKWQSVCSNVLDAPRYNMWFANAFKSTCFKASSTSASLDGVTKDIREVAEKEMPYYEEMHKLRITP
ncbi:uncharacterized protein [Diadema antillarum]|uniref:uncharacterized protein n=1 Tax=Diadema antillarum TaxID=105358 RepID=UPI003A8C452D